MRQSAVAVVAFLLLLFGCSTQVPIQPSALQVGVQYFEQGKYEKARDTFEAILTEAKSERDILKTAIALKWLGSIKNRTGLYDDALALYSQAWELLDDALSVPTLLSRDQKVQAAKERANVLNNIAVVYIKQGRFEQAIAMHKEVLDQDERSGDIDATVISLNNLGVTYNRYAVAADAKGDGDAFLERLDTAKMYFLRSLSLKTTPDAYLNYGNTHAFRGDKDSAVVLFEKARKLYHEQGWLVQEAKCLGNIGFLLRELGRDTEAVDALKQAVEIVEELRGNLSSIDVRTSFVSDKYYLYENLIGLLVKEGSIEQAFVTVERAKARSFLDMLGNRTVGEGKERDERTAALVARERALERRIGNVVQKPDSAAVLVDLITRHKAVLSELTKLDPEYASLKSVGPISVRALQNTLSDSTALVEYYLGDWESYVFVVRKDTIVAARLGIKSKKELEGKVERFRRLLYSDFPREKMRFIRKARLTDNMSMKEALKAWYATVTPAAWQYRCVQLYAVLMAPVQQWITGVKELYIVPHGVLHHLPFQVLVTPLDIDRRKNVHIRRPRFLIEDYRIAYLPSASVLQFVSAPRSRELNSALIVGDPLYADPKYRKRPLEGALRESDSVSVFFPEKTVLKREQAEEAVVKSAIRTPAVVHLATHGELNTRNPLQSRILLAAKNPVPPNDGNLTVAEVFNLSIRAGLVALSACQTAEVSGKKGRFTPGDDLIGLSRSFLYAGALDVLASLWYVDDRATLEFMKRFYYHLVIRHRTKAGAARLAAIDLMNNPVEPDWKFPYYWAAFILIGFMY
ncbi:MAG: CHAT domain-containing protein [Chlorobi bacterium]|nr:CHAT domain-containing protein [Chlorobiota bacterium]